MAQELAIAIDSRGFGHGRRTYINVLTMSRRDMVLFGAIIAVFVLLVYARFWDIGIPALI
jgi:energy-coupling factor transporter transmembrane protein EcfT